MGRRELPPTLHSQQEVNSLHFLLICRISKSQSISSIPNAFLVCSISLFLGGLKIGKHQSWFLLFLLAACHNRTVRDYLTKNLYIIAGVVNWAGKTICRKSIGHRYLDDQLNAITKSPWLFLWTFWRGRRQSKWTTDAETHRTATAEPVFLAAEPYFTCSETTHPQAQTNI